MAQQLFGPRHCCKHQPEPFRRAAASPQLVPRKRSVLQPLAAHHRRYNYQYGDASDAFQRAASNFLHASGFTASTVRELLQQIERDWGMAKEGKTRAGASATATATASTAPFDNVYPVDSMETSEDMTYFIDVPGLEKRDLKIQVNHVDKTMTVSGERCQPMPPQDPELATTNINIERAFGSFSRTVTLPESADFELISAKVDKGVLRIKVLKQIKQESEIHEVEID